MNPKEPLDDTFVPKIYIDGGPCSGKTTLMTDAVARLGERGIIPVVVPEAATLLINAGFKPKGSQDILFQRAVVGLQLGKERRATEKALSIRAKTGKRVVLLCDRGLMSGSAYLGDDPDDQQRYFQENVLSHFGLDMEQVRSHYIGAIHMVTTAIGAEDYYTCDGNSARKETIEEARQLDGRSERAVLGHDNVRKISNRNPDRTRRSANEKIQIAIAAVFDFLGDPYPVQMERKFKLKGHFSPNDIVLPHQHVRIQQTYLESEQGEEFVRERYVHGSISQYSWVRKTPHPSGGRVKITNILSQDEYLKLLVRRSRFHQTIVKDRYCFFHNDQYMKIDFFKNGLSQPIMEFFGEPQDFPAIMSDYLVSEITHVREFYNHELAKKY